MASIDDSDVPETGAVFTFGRSRFADNLTNKFWIRNDRIIHIATGDEHSVVVTERGRLYSFGTNDWGQLGLGHSKAVNKPSFIKALKPNKMVLAACGRTHTIVASEAGKVFSFGSGGDGQLGHGNTEDQNLPKQIEGLPIGKVKLLSCGVYHSAVLFESGDLYTWGSGSDGQSGHEEEETLEPKKLKFESKVSWVACGYYHTAVVTDNGKLYTFGENEFGKLGLTGSQVNDTSRPQPVATEEGSFIAVACGAGHTVALTDEGKVFSFGDGSRGQLGQGTRTQEMSVPKIIEQLSHLKIEAVSCGDCHSAVITEKGKLYTFGDGRHGKLAQGEECFSNLFRPQLVSRFAEFRVQSVSCGGCHTLVTAIRKEHDSNDEEDEADGVLNASMTSSYSYASMNEANATMRLQGLSNTVPMISPRDKRRKKEAENLANSFSGSFKHITKNDLPALGMTLDRNRLPQIPKIKEPTRKESESSQVSNKMTKESKSNIEEKSKDMNVEKRNMKNSQKDKDEIEFKKKLEKELGDDMKNDKQKNIESKKVEIKEDGKERLDSDDKGKVLDKGKDENEEEDDEESEEDDEEEEEEETESEDDDEAEAKSEGQVSEIKKHSNSTKEDAIDKGLTVQKTVVRDELGKKKEEDEDEEEEEESDEEEETDEDGEEDDDDDEEDDEEEDDDDDDDDEEDEDEEEDNVDKAKLKTENNKDSIEKEAVIEVNSNATDDKSDTKDVKNDKIEDKKDKKNAKDDKKKGKGDKKKNKNDKSDKIDDKENINKGDSKNEDGSSENNNNNMEDAEKIETNEKEKLITEDDKKGKSKFGGLFGRKKQPATVNQESKDEVDGEAGKTAPKKTGKSGVCSIL